jgi:hypothetical protein
LPAGVVAWLVADATMGDGGSDAAGVGAGAADGPPAVPQATRASDAAAAEKMDAMDFPNVIFISGVIDIRREMAGAGKPA